MIANIISRYTYSLTDTLTATEYNLSFDGDYNGKSQFVFFRQPIADEDDFIILADHDGIIYQGIISEIENEKGKNHYTVTAKEMQSLFDQKIILSNESLLSTGIEDFISNQISENFISNSDTIVNITYLQTEVRTHTPISAEVSTESGVYNLCTYIGNALTKYGIFVDFEFTTDALKVVIEKKEQSILKFDTGISQIINLVENVEVSVMAKLTVLWNGTTRNFFLKTDRTITETQSNPDRAKGSVDVLVSEAETEAAMIQEAYDMFKSNSYNHKITFDLIEGSRLIEASEVYIGRNCIVKTESGIRESIITGIDKSSNSNAISIALGNMKVTLIEKLKGGEAR